MRYQGGKGRLAAQLAPVILAEANGRPIVELFHGGLAMTAALQPRVAVDLSRPMAALIKAVRSGWTPPPIDAQAYAELKSRRDCLDDPDVAFAGHCASFGGKWFGGLARPHEKQRDPIGAAWATLQKRVAATADVDFQLCDYATAPVTPGDVVYCDPPYQDTSADWPVAPFDHAQFWFWASHTAWKGCTVIISEFSAPDGVETLWSKPRATFTRRNDQNQVVESLFILRGGE